MGSGRRVDQAKGVFCLEANQWHGRKDGSSVEPILSLLERLKGYLHKRVATPPEFKYVLERYLQPIFKTHPVLYLAFRAYHWQRATTIGP